METFDFWENALEKLKSFGQRIKAIEYKLGLIADYTVEVGQSGIWTYEKKASGIAKCWGEYTETKSPYVTLSGGWYGFYTSNVPLPFEFAQKPDVNASLKIGSSLSSVSPLHNITKTTVSCYGMAYGASGSALMTVDFDIKGFWKDFIGGVLSNIMALLPGKAVIA